MLEFVLLTLFCAAMIVSRRLLLTFGGITFIHELGHRIAIAYYTKKLKYTPSRTEIYLGVRAVHDIPKIRVKRFLGMYKAIGSKDLTVGRTHSEFYRKLALDASSYRFKVIRKNAMAGAFAVALFGVISLVISIALLVFLSPHLNNPNSAEIALTTFILTFILDLFIARWSAGFSGHLTDINLYKNPLNFIQFYSQYEIEWPEYEVALKNKRTASRRTQVERALKELTLREGDIIITDPADEIKRSVFKETD